MLLWLLFLLLTHSSDRYRDGIRVRDDIIIAHHRTKRSTKPSTLRNRLWPKSSDGKVYIPYIIANHYRKRLHMFHVLQEYIQDLFWFSFSFFIICFFVNKSEAKAKIISERPAKSSLKTHTQKIERINKNTKASSCINPLLSKNE